MPLRVRITIILFCFSLHSFSLRWPELNDSLIYYYKEGEYDKALLFAEKAKRTAQSEFGETHINYNKSLTNLAIVYDRKGMLPEAEEIRKSIATINKILFGENSLEYATALNQLGLLYEKLKNIKKLTFFLTMVMWPGLI